MGKLFRMAHYAKQQVQGFFTYLCKNLAPGQRMEGRKALAFKAFCVVQYALNIGGNQTAEPTGTLQPQG